MAGSRLYAALYDRVMSRADAAGLADRRRRLVADARGRVLEVGGGTGANLEHYRDVEAVTVLEPDAAMRRRLLERLGAARVPAVVVEAGIEDAPFDDASFDTVVTSLVLCSVDDVTVALDRVRRLLRPGGRLLFLEHVRAPGLRGRAQHLATPVWRRVAGGCHLDRDLVGDIRRAGFVVTDCDRFPLPASGGLPAAQGVAVARTSVGVDR